MIDFDVEKIYNSSNNYHHTRISFIAFNKIIYFIFIIENAIINYLYINHIIISSLIRNI